MAMYKTVGQASRTAERCRTMKMLSMRHTAMLWANCRCNCDTCQSRVAFLKLFNSVFFSSRDFFSSTSAAKISHTDPSVSKSNL